MSVEHNIPIYFNGQEYSSFEAMPEQVRLAYARSPAYATTPPSQEPVKPRFVYDGQVYTLDSLPPEVRARYDEAVQRTDANQNGIPDFLEGSSPVLSLLAKLAGKASLQAGDPAPQPGLAPDQSYSPDNSLPALSSPVYLPVEDTSTTVDAVFPANPPGRRAALSGMALIVLALLACLVIVFIVNRFMNF